MDEFGSEIRIMNFGFTLREHAQPDRTAHTPSSIITKKISSAYFQLLLLSGKHQ